MSDENSPKLPETKQMGFYPWVAVLAAAIGFAAVYVTLNRPDNGLREPAEPVARPAAAPSAAPSSALTAARQGSFNRLSSGHMATFVFHKTPKSLPEISFVDLAGGKKQLSDWRGKVILLNLWATWCAPCRKEMPGLDRLQAQLGSDQFEVIALSIDRRGVKAAKRFLDQIKVVNLAAYNDSTASLNAKLKVIGLPTTLLLDKDGREIGRLVGPAEWDSDDAKKLIKAQLTARP